MSTLAEGHEGLYLVPASKRLPVQMPTLLFTGSPKRSSRDRGKFRSVHVPGDSSVERADGAARAAEQAAAGRAVILIG
jgi:hypothetical protein